MRSEFSKKKSSLITGLKIHESSPSRHRYSSLRSCKCWKIVARPLRRDDGDGIESTIDRRDHSEPASSRCWFLSSFGRFCRGGGLSASPDLSSSPPALLSRPTPTRSAVLSLPPMLLKMAQPALALSLLQELGLAPAVYAPPEQLVPPLPDGGFDWPRGTAVARAAARLLGLRSNLSEVGVPKSGAVDECAPVAGSMKGAEDQGGRSGPVSGKAGVVGLGTGVDSTSAQTSDETREGWETSKEGDEEAYETEPSRGYPVSTGGKERSGDVKKKQAPTTLLRELFLCAALLPLAGVKQKTKKGKLVSAAQSVVADSLKVSIYLFNLCFGSTLFPSVLCFESTDLQKPCALSALLDNHILLDSNPEFPFCCRLRNLLRVPSVLLCCSPRRPPPHVFSMPPPKSSRQRKRRTLEIF